MGSEMCIRDRDMSDYGTTKPERVDISTLPNVEYSDNSGVDTYYGDDE